MHTQNTSQNKLKYKQNEPGGVMASRILFVCVCVFMSSAFAQTPQFKGYILKINSTRDISASKELIESQGIEITSSIPQLNLLVVKSLNKNLLDLKDTVIERIEPNYIVKRTEVIESLEAEPLGNPIMYWNYRAIKLGEAWQVTHGSKDVIIAVSDTGVYYDHFELGPNTYFNPGENGFDQNGVNKAKNKIDDDGNGFVDDYAGWNFSGEYNNARDDHYHGTHVAGTIAAGGMNNNNFAGVMWQASIMPLKFLGSDGSGTTEGAIKTILYAADNGAKAINCSWGGDGYSQSLFESIEYAKEKGVLIIAAAGNDDRDTDKKPMYPASYNNENIISVAATTDLKHGLAWFSNYGLTTVDIAAPGRDIYSTVNPMVVKYPTRFFEVLSGTSMAAPHVAGVVGLMYSVNPNLTWREAKRILMETVQPSKYLKGKTVSGGTMDAGAAVSKAKDLL